MGKGKLILSNTPSLRVPIQFFFIAILFGVVTAIIMLWQGPNAFTTRWSPTVLAVSHALVLGFIGLTMQGALLQIVSVVLGKQPPFVERLSQLTHLLSSVGTCLLILGFLTTKAQLLLFSGVIIGLSFFIFIGSISYSIARRKARSDTGIGFVLAILSLLLTWLLGLWLVLGYNSNNIDLDRQLTDIHLAWGLFGWVSILIFTVAYEVVPMFQMTGEYPAIIKRLLAITQFLGLLLLTAHLFTTNTLLLNVGEVIIVLCLGLFSTTTLWLQVQRKKKQSDPSLWFWRMAMLFLLLALIFWLMAQLFPSLSGNPGYPLILGILIIFGFILSVINGMLYKIIPFLAWLHLSMLVTECKVSRRLIPNIKKMNSTPLAYIQFGLHLLTNVLMLIFVSFSTGFTAAALSLLASCLLLLWNLVSVMKLYKNSQIEILKSSAL